MSKNQNSFIKKQKAQLKQRKKKEKFEKKLERKAQPKDGSLENMMVYVDEFGNFSDSPPEPPTPKKQLNQNKSYSKGAAQNK
ncbi:MULTISPECIES: cold-shock protein [Algoriphagus]|uniref:Cold-shock protein n=2 Tax=Algoriphagus TaxID=246875 RepID=A0A4Y9QYC6_9BACT|nr:MULTISPECIES: cold-shock protein [Algoriphagus]MCS5489275.1 cold-shock protein [Algoriphagus limi]TFV97491.1 cold-shock protein [Algoriphagus kandeliae]